MLLHDLYKSDVPCIPGQKTGLLEQAALCILYGGKDGVENAASAQQALKISICATCNIAHTSKE